MKWIDIKNELPPEDVELALLVQIKMHPDEYSQLKGITRFFGRFTRSEGWRIQHMDNHNFFVVAWIQLPDIPLEELTK